MSDDIDTDPASTTRGGSSMSKSHPVGDDVDDIRWPDLAADLTWPALEAAHPELLVAAQQTDNNEPKEH